MSDAHFPPEQLEQYAAGGLPPEVRSQVEAHLRECAQCRRVVIEAVESGGGSTLPPGWMDRTAPSWPPHPGLTAELAVGSQLGRYVIVHRVGQGAMGVVYAAYDPALDRKVAVKVLRPDVPQVESAALRERLLREAQALARLTHPNVVGVHDAGDHAGSIFLAMDFVEGHTLGEWLRESPRSPREIVAKFLAAGAGLAAAHEAGLVHRDFKPDNVFVGADGSVRVGDFGLARRAKGDGPRPPNADAETITERGSLIGTPAYMSPEQLRGASVDATSDQFSFCVALYEALYGERPYGGETIRELRESTSSGKVRPPRAGLRVPSRIRRVLLRGLSPRPADRFPTMSALLHALRPRVSKRSIAAAVAALVVVTAVSAVLAARWSWRRSLCESPGPRVEQFWGPTVRGAAEAAFQKSTAPYARDVWRTTSTVVDEWFGRWAEAYGTACAEVRQSGRAEGAAWEKLSCLDAELEHVAGTTSLFARANEAVISHAAVLVDGLHAGPGCDQRISATRARASMDPQRRLRQIELRARLDELISQRSVRGASAEVEPLERLLAEARREGFDELAARVLLEQAAAAALRMRFDAAEAAAREAVRVAELAHDDYLAAYAWLELAQTVGYWKADVARAQELIEAARLAVVRAARPPGGLDVDLLQIEASIVLVRGGGAEALELQRKAAALAKEVWGERSVRYIVAELDVDILLIRLGHAAEALERNDQQARAIAEVLGKQHPTYAQVLGHRATILGRLQRNDEAIPVLEEAMRILENANAADSSTYSVFTRNLGLLHLRMRRFDLAVTTIERAIRHFEARDKTNTQLTEFYGALAETFQELGKLDQALAAADHGVELHEKANRATYGNPAMPYLIRGSIFTDLKRPLDASRDLELSVQLMTESNSSPYARAVAKYELARALWSQPARRMEAVTLAVGVRKYFAEKGAAYQENVDEVDAWLKKHRM